MIDLLLGLAIGAALGAFATSVWWLVRRSREHAALANVTARADALDDQIQIARVEAEKARELATQSERAREDAEKQALSHRKEMESMRRQFEEQKRMLDEAERKLAAVFKAAGSEALKANSEQFLTLARQAFDTLLAQAKGDVEKRQLAIDNLVKPIRELLEQQSKAVNEIEKKREGAYARIDEQIRAIAASHSELRMETGRLVTALRRPQQRGRWGELQLRNAVELAGMTAHCDFDEQVTVWNGEQTQRPDMIIKLPGGGMIVVDAKVAIDAYLCAIDCEAERDAHLKRHAQQVESHVRKLAEKKYWEQFARTPKVVVMFMPLESALVAALEVQPDLQADAMAQHVLIATPTLLVALLRAVAYGWRQEDVAANAQKIAETGRQLYERLSTFVAHFEKVGSALRRGSEAYNAAVGSMERSLLPGARRFKELNVTGAADIEPPQPVEIVVRPIVAPELQMLPYAKIEDSPPEEEVELALPSDAIDDNGGMRLG